MQPKKHVDESLYALVITGSAFMLFLGGSWMFFSDFEYRDHGQLWVFAVFAVSTFLAGFFGLRRTHVLTALFAILSLGSTFYSDAKYDWRRDYLESKQMNQPMLLEPFIAEYPSFETYLFGHFWGAEDPVRLSKQCLEPMLNEQPTTGKCGSYKEMVDTYRIDVHGLMASQYQKMKDTAKRIKEGELKTAGAYAQCLANKVCAPIPLLPKGVKADEIDANSPTQYYDVRKAYWALISERHITAEVCAFMPLCSALVKGKLADPNNPLGVTIQ